MKTTNQARERLTGGALALRQVAALLAAHPVTDPVAFLVESAALLEAAREEV